MAKPDIQFLSAALAGYQHRLSEINEKMAEIRRHLGGSSAVSAAPAAERPPASPKRKRNLSAAGRKAIVDAAKKRWAAIRAAKAAAAKPPAAKKSAPKPAPAKKTAKKKAAVKKAAPKKAAAKPAPTAPPATDTTAQ